MWWITRWGPTDRREESMAVWVGDYVDYRDLEQALGTPWTGAPPLPHSPPASLVGASVAENRVL